MPAHNKMIAESNISDFSESRSRLRLLQLISPNLPTGAFTYSQGMEWAVETGWLTNLDDSRDWLVSVLQDSLASLELPLLYRLISAAQQQQQTTFFHWSQYLYASRETFELRQEEKQRARALYSLLSQLPEASDWPELNSWKPALLKSQLASYALAASHWHIKPLELIEAYSWSWLENAVAVAIKLVPLGQTQGQQLLYELAPPIIAAAHHASQIEDKDLSTSSCAMAIASSLHETQYSRLFRS